MNDLSNSYRPFLFVVAIWAYGSAGAYAATFTVPITLEEATAPDGSYLSAPFDFGISFSQVESLTLEFVMPSGYEGTVLSTGNSSYIRSLGIVSHDASAQIELLLPLGATYSLSQSVFRIPAEATTSIGFLSPPLYIGERIEVASTWPSFVLQGSGRIALIDISSSYSHPLPTKIVVSSTITWSTPGSVIVASLTIVGTPVPEPHCLLLLLLGAEFVATCAFRRRTG